MSVALFSEVVLKVMPSSKGTSAKITTPIVALIEKRVSINVEPSIFCLLPLSRFKSIRRYQDAKHGEGESECEKTDQILCESLALSRERFHFTISSRDVF